MSSINSISPDKLIRLVGVPHGPALIDVRTDEDFAANPCLIPAAVRRSHAGVAGWAGEFAGKSAVVVCRQGQDVSEGVASWIRHAGARSAEVLAGGLDAWSEAKLPMVSQTMLPPHDGNGRTV